VREARRDEDFKYSCFHVSENFYCNFAVSENYADPQSVSEALKRSDKSFWQQAMKTEYDNMLKNKTWILVNRPDNVKVITTKWVFKLKKKSEGQPVRYRARLVARGFNQTYGIDYLQTYSFTVQPSTMRLLFALVAEKNWLVDHVDIEAAFLHGDVQEEIYIEQPENFILKGSESKVCK